MLNEIAQMIQRQVADTRLFKQVLLSTNEQHVYQFPAAIIYLDRDAVVDNCPTSRRELTWVIAVAVRATPATESQATVSVYEILDRVRDTLTNWLPMRSGIQPASVPHIQFVEWQQGVMVYEVRLVMRVIPSVFNP